MVQLAKVEDFIEESRSKNDKIETFKTSEGQELKIRAIKKLDFAIGFGSALMKMMDNDAEAYADDKKRTEFLESLTEKQRQYLLRSQWQGIKHNVCKAIQDFNFVIKKPLDCDKETNEVSIDDLADIDIFIIWKRVKVLSGLPDTDNDPFIDRF